MKHFCTLLLATLFIDCAYAEQIHTTVYVQWGDATWQTTGEVGGAYAYANDSYTIFTNSNTFFFDGESIATTQYRKASIILRATISDPHYSNQICSGSCSFTDTLHVAGSSITGFVRYVVQFTQIRTGSPSPISQTPTFQHNGTNILSAENRAITTIGTMEDPFYQMRIDAKMPIKATEPIITSVDLNASMNIVQGDLIQASSVSVEVIDITFETEKQTPITDYSIVSSHGILAPASSPLKIMQSDSDIAVNWHSLTNRQYKRQYSSNITEHDWMDLTNPVQGSGSIDSFIVTNPSQGQLFRVIESYQRK